MSEIRHWLEGIGLPQYGDALEQNDMDSVAGRLKRLGSSGRSSCSWKNYIDAAAIFRRTGRRLAATRLKTRATCGNRGPCENVYRSARCRSILDVKRSSFCRRSTSRNSSLDTFDCRRLRRALPMTWTMTLGIWS